jgi:hypothetical protein
MDSNSFNKKSLYLVVITFFMGDYIEVIYTDNRKGRVIESFHVLQ